MKSLAAACLLLSIALPVAAQDDGPRRATTAGKDGSWFGVSLPPKAGSSPAVKTGTRAPRPIAADLATPEFNGAAMKADVDTIVGFARNKEIGNGQMWGRIAGFPSSDRTVDVR